MDSNKNFMVTCLCPRFLQAFRCKDWLSDISPNTVETPLYMSLVYHVQSIKYIPQWQFQCILCLFGDIKERMRNFKLANIYFQLSWCRSNKFSPCVLFFPCFTYVIITDGGCQCWSSERTRQDGLRTSN